MPTRDRIIHEGWSLHQGPARCPEHPRGRLPPTSWILGDPEGVVKCPRKMGIDGITVERCYLMRARKEPGTSDRNVHPIMGSKTTRKVSRDPHERWDLPGKTDSK